MKNRFIFTALMAALVTSVAYADPVDYIHPTKDVLSGECVVTSEGVTYHNMQYPSNPRTYDGGYVKFTAENEGDPVTINFSEFNCLRNEQPIVFLYDGEEILKENFTGYSSAVPAGYMAAMRPENVNTDYVATSGVLCVLYAPASKSDFVTGYPTGSISGGYTASVTAGTPKDMEFSQAVAENAGVSLYRGARDAVMGTLTVKMDGSLNPLTLDELTIDVAEIAASGKVENIRLYSGSSFTDDNLLLTLADGATTLTVPSGALKAKNVYTIVADVKADATGEVPAAAISTLRIAGTAREVDATALAPLTITNEIWIPGDGSIMTYTITDPADFYDAGGPAAVVPVKAKGTVTFIPANEGEKIQVDVRSLALFNTSSTGLNDKFRFYNGREANADNLIAELLNDAKMVKSTAADGSLTVTFEALQGNAGKDGWEAVVSQFTPAPMLLSGVEAEAAEAVTPAAGEKNVPLLLFNVKTTRQLDPLTVNAITLTNAAGTDASAISAVKVYYLGETATFSTRELYAEGALSASTSITGSMTLAEGDNWFAVAADIADNVLSAAEAGVTLTGITVGETASTPTGTTTAKVTVDNTCRITEGTHTHTMYGDWKFLSPAPTGYSSSYPASTADHVVTFVPTREGAVAQITFESFDVYYASSSYGSKSTFEVYSGTTTDAANLIWKLDSGDASKTGPGRKLRSASADGAITVKFNPNTSSSYYCGKGWTANVIQFVDHDAEIKSVSVSQASTAILAPGAANAELLMAEVVTEGTLNPLTLASVNLELRGKEAVKAVNVLTSATGNLADATLWGSAAVPAEGTAVTITPAEGVETAPLAEDSNTLFITVDIQEQVESDIAVDARLNSFGFAGGKTYAVAEGDPEGNRFTKNVYILQEGTGHAVTVGRPIMFYDEGGPDGPITKGFKGTVTFVPANVDEVLTVNAESFSISSGKMYLYSGREVNSENILKNTDRSLDYYNTTNGPANLISKAADGSITVDYAGPSYLYSEPDGFAISVIPVKAQVMDVENITVSDGADIDVVRGSSDVPVAHIAVKAAGTSGTLVISGLEADFNASKDVADILGAQLCYTGASGNFAPTTAIAAKVSPLVDGKAAFEFSAPVEISDAGTYHFWITADLSSTATPGNKATATLASLTANGAPATLPESCSGSRTMVTGMGGTYRVGPSENAKYHTIGAAVRALELGVEDAVLFLIEDGEYHENLTIADVAGSSAAHPVVFSSLSGNRDNVIISGASVLEKQGMILVENSSYIHFRNLTIAPNSTAYYAGIHFKDGSRHCSVENCVVKSGAVTGVSSGISLVRTEGLSEANRNCDNFTIKDSYIEGGYIALYLGGSGYVNMPKDNGLQVTGNTVVNAYSKGLYIYDCEDFTVSGNTVTSYTSAKNGYNGMDIYRPTGSFKVIGNKVTCSQTLDFTGIKFRNGGGSTDANAPALIANNAVSAPNPASGYTYGVMIDVSATNVVFAHNTINIKGDASLKSVYGLAFSGNAPTEGALSVVNNIIQNSTAEGALRPWNDTHYANIRFAGNVYYGPNDIVDCDDKTLAEYQTATGDLTSVMQQASFFSDTDLHLREAGDNMKFPCHELVTTDADGNERPVQATAGAYEYAPVVVEKPEIMEGYPAVASVRDVSAVVNTRWTVGGSLYAMAVKAGETAPDAEALKATRPVTIEADTEVPYTFNFLEQLTAYKAYFLVVSALEEESVIVESPEFTTAETVEPLAVEIMWDEEPVKAGESILLQASVAGGKEPYAYEWFNQMDEIISGDDHLMEEATVNQTYRLRVTSSDGQIVNTKAHVPVVTKGLVTGGFDDHYLAAESNWRYDPFHGDNVDPDSFFSGSFSFSNYPSSYEGVWGGFGYANETATAFGSYDDQFRNAVGGGALTTANYGVSYMYGSDCRISLPTFSDGTVVPGVYITNAAVTLNSMLNGDGWCEKFTAEKADYLTLTIIGYDKAGTETGRVDVPLADYRETPAFVLTEWKWVDLSPLGSVSSLKFDYESSQRGRVPGYACFDELGAKNPSTGVDSFGTEGDMRLAFPAADCLSVLGIEGDYTLRIYTSDGVLRAEHRLSGATTVSTAGLPAGICLAEILTDGGARKVLRFMKK